MALTSYDPATGEAVGDVETASSAAVAEAVEAARAAQADWAQVSMNERLGLVAAFRSLVARRRDEIATLVTRESGKPLAEARVMDVLPTLETARHLQQDAGDVLGRRRIKIGNPILFDRRSYLEWEPLGVVAVISPWNYPLAIPATGLLTALVAGNGAILKPAEQTPLVGQWLVDRLHEAGFPEGLVRVVHGGAETGKALVASDVDGVVFTGSAATGKAIAAACAAHLRPSVLELGGKDAMVVLKGADEDAVVGGALWGAFANAGQTCSGVERLFLPRLAHDRIVSRLVEGAAGLRLGHGLEAGTQMGPLIDDAAVRRMHDQVRDAEKKGATVAIGGTVQEELGPRFFRPTVLTDVEPTMACMTDETFGPLLPVRGSCSR